LHYIDVKIWWQTGVCPREAMIPHDRNMLVWKMQGLQLHALAERAKLTMELDISSQEGSPEFQYEMHAATGDAKAAGRAAAERARRAMLII
jgi:uncharacterized protein YaeQ